MMDLTTEMMTLSVTNVTRSATSALSGGHASDALAWKAVLGVLIKVLYAAGIAGNAAAVVCLRRGERRVRNRKHLLLLTSLAVNDLVALVGMMCSKLVEDHVLVGGVTRLYCGARVLLRTFGIGSVCIAVTMALERYLALTRPFLYQKKVTYYMIRMALLMSWFFAAVLTCAPLMGLSRYYDAHAVTTKKTETGLVNVTGPACVRYRNAREPLDFGYAVFYVFFGTLLCVVLVYCNLAVIKALYAITTPGGGGGGAGGGAAPLVRRVSKTSCRQKPRTLPAAGGAVPLHQNAATAEEVAFSRLMATLSVLFMICWLPQMVTSALYLALRPSLWPHLRMLGFLSDMLMLLNYVLNPILYVLMRKRKLCAPCFRRGHKTSTESMSMKTSCCAPDTLVISDSSVEGRPLRALTDLSPTAAKTVAPSAALLDGNKFYK